MTYAEAVAKYGEISVAEIEALTTGENSCDRDGYYSATIYLGYEWKFKDGGRLEAEIWEDWIDWTCWAGGGKSKIAWLKVSMPSVLYHVMENARGKL